MSHCDLCNKGIRAIPFNCRHCGMTLCPEHRLQEQHECQGPRKQASPSLRG